VKPGVFCQIGLPVLVVMFAALPCTVTAQRPGLANPPVLDDVEAAFSRIETRAAHAAAGLFVDPVTKAMSVYATPGWLDGDTVKVSIYSSGAGEPVHAR
jgi:hypothetical protein